MFRFQLSHRQAVYNKIRYTRTYKNVQDYSAEYWRPNVSNRYSLVSVSAYDTQQDIRFTQ